MVCQWLVRLVQAGVCQVTECWWCIITHKDRLADCRGLNFLLQLGQGQHCQLLRAGLQYIIDVNKHKQHCWTPKKTNPDVIQVVKLSAHLQALRQAINNTPKHKLDIYRPGNKTPDSKACQHNASSYSVRQYQCLKLAQLMREQPDTKHADIEVAACVQQAPS